MNILIIGDLHAPYQHPDALDFLACLKDTYSTDIDVSIGDEFDIHAISAHKSNPALLSPGDEYEAAKKVAAELEEICPKLLVCRSNHGMRPWRVAKDAGIPDLYIRTEQDLYDKPNWTWADKHVLTLDSGLKVVCSHGHGMGGKAIAVRARQLAPYATVQGHRHTEGGVLHYSLPTGETAWAAQTGCLIDPTHPAFSYASFQPVLGSLVIYEDVPIFEPMKLDKRGRWTGSL